MEVEKKIMQKEEIKKLVEMTLKEYKAIFERLDEV